MKRVTVAQLSIAVATALTLAACGVPDGSVTVTNRTGATIRAYGACVPDNDAQVLEPGATSHWFFAHADCLVDDGDGVHGILGCITLTQAHTDITLDRLRSVDVRDPMESCQATG